MTFKTVLKTFLAAAWFIVAFYMFNYSLEWLTAADTIVNTIGALTIVTIVLMTIMIYRVIINPKPPKT